MLNGRTVLEIETRILMRARIGYKQFSSDNTAATGKTNLRQVLNDAQNRINAFRWWSWLVKQMTITGTGTRVIELPNQDFQRELRIVDSLQRKVIYVVPYTEFIDRAPVEISVGSPQFAAFPDQNHIATQPALTSGDTLTMDYIREMPELIADTDSPDVPSAILGPYSRALIECVLIDVFERKNDQRAAQRQETIKYPIALKELIRLAGAGDTGIHVREAYGAQRPMAYPVMPAVVPAP